MSTRPRCVSSQLGVNSHRTEEQGGEDAPDKRGEGGQVGGCAQERQPRAAVEAEAGLATHLM